MNQPSPARRAIEAHLQALPGGQTASVEQLAKATGTTKAQAASIMQTLRHKGFAVNAHRTNNQGQWRCTGREETPNETNAERQARLQTRITICNGNQPNGSTTYWRAFEAKRMAAARFVGRGDAA